MENFSIQCPENVTMLIEQLEAAGHEAYVVGGCVRDALLGLTPHDWDITTSASPQEIKDIFHHFKTLDTGIKHGTVTVVLDDLYEITTFRVDGAYSDGRHPDSVAFSRNIGDDLSRRDFTINAMAYSPLRGLIDLFGGTEDLQNRVIRCVGDANQRMLEDALRVMRAIRFQSRLGFSIAPETRHAVEKNIPHLSHVSAERIGSEFFKTVTAPYAAQTLRGSLSLIRYLIPEWSCPATDAHNAMFDALQAAASPLTPLPAAWADESVRLALFFHELFPLKGQAKQNAATAVTVMKRLKYSNDTIRSVQELVEYHSLPLPLKRADAKRLLGKLTQPQLHRLLKMLACIAANLACPNQAMLADVMRLYETLGALQSENAACSLKDLAITGSDLIANGIPAGPRLGQVMAALLEEVLNDLLPNERGGLLRRAKELNELKG